MGKKCQIFLIGIIFGYLLPLLLVMLSSSIAFKFINLLLFEIFFITFNVCILQITSFLL